MSVEEEAVAQGERRSPRATLRGVVPRVARWTTGIIGFVGALLGVVFVLFPALQPEPPAATKGAELSDPAREELSWGQYLDRKDLDRAPYDAPALRRRGIFVEFDFAIEGYKGKSLPLRWQLIDARQGDQLAKSRDEFIVPEASTDKGSWAVWVPVPRRRAQELYVQLQLYEDRGEVPIGRLRTPPFALRTG